MNDTHDNFHHHVGKLEHLYRKVLHTLELIIAGVTIIALVFALAVNVWNYFADPATYNDTIDFLHTILNVVVGLEFVRMLIDMTPANTLEVLIMATARHIIMNHGEPMTLLIGVICVGGLFAIRRYLIPKNELTLDLVEIE